MPIPGGSPVPHPLILLAASDDALAGGLDIGGPQGEREPTEQPPYSEYADLEPGRQRRRRPTTPTTPEAPVTGTDLVPHPLTGEQVDLRAPTDTLARYRYELVQARRTLDEFGALLDEELVARLDAENARSLEAGAYTLKTTAPDVTRWDVPELGVILEALVTDGRVSRGAATRALKQTVEYKAVPVELKKLLGHPDPEVRAAIEACRTVAPDPRRRITVNPRSR